MRTNPLHFTVLPVLVALLSTACGFGFERQSEVLDRRVLAIRSEPAELIADGVLPATVEVSALVADPKTGIGPVTFEWRVCTSAVAGGSVNGKPAKGAPNPLTGRCDEGDPDTLVASGAKSVDEISQLAVPVPIPASLGPALAIAASRGFAVSVYVDAQLKLSNDPTPLYANKRVVVSPPVPAGRTANRNPKLTAIVLDGEPWAPDVPRALSLHVCDDKHKVTVVDPVDASKTIVTCAHDLTPAYDPSQGEKYVVQQFDGTPLAVRERLRFAWFSDQGSFSNQTTEEADEVGPAQKDPISTQWNEPPTANGLVTIWIVVRDGRGGTSWERRQVTFTP